jgi:uncharacterized membrane protein YphA (DoxX/SURF4 family)
VRRYTAVISAMLMVVGVAIVVRALFDDGSSPLFRVVLGVLFIAAGAGRLYLQRRPA